jgi:hypothetical protein
MDESLGVILFGDLRRLFTDNHADRLSSAQIVEALSGLKTDPDRRCTRDKPISTRGLAKILGRHRVGPGLVRFGDTETVSVDLREELKHLLHKFLPPPDCIYVTTPQPPSEPPFVNSSPAHRAQMLLRETRKDSRQIRAVLLCRIVIGSGAFLSRSSYLR